MSLSAVSLLALGLLVSGPTDPPKFERIVIDPDFPGGYQVEVADVNGDKKPDIVALGGSTCAWYENPSWKKRIISTSKDTPGIISSATRDLDGDGKAEVAIAYEFAMNRPKTGKLLLAVQGATVDQPWTFRPIADVPSIHRLRWADPFGDGRAALVVAPLFGSEAMPPLYAAPARLQLYLTSGSKRDIQLVPSRPDAPHDAPVTHAIEVRDVDRQGGESILTASNLGIQLVKVARTAEENLSWSFTPLVSGDPGDGPKRGSSEIHLGSFRDRTRLLATIEPWHGDQVVVYASDVPDSLKFGDRRVIDDTLAEGHALWTADIDGDSNDEVFAGHRGKDHRVSVYKFDGKDWQKTVIDREIAAQDLRGGDLDGDGTLDVVAIGGATHNVIWYRPLP